MKKDQATVENKTKTATKGDLAAKGDGNKPADFSQGPQYFNVIPTDNRMYGEFANRLDDKAMISKMENKIFMKSPCQTKAD